MAASLATYRQADGATRAHVTEAMNKVERLRGEVVEGAEHAELACRRALGIQQENDDLLGKLSAAESALKVVLPLRQRISLPSRTPACVTCGWWRRHATEAVSLGCRVRGRRSCSCERRCWKRSRRLCCRHERQHCRLSDLGILASQTYPRHRGQYSGECVAESAGRLSVERGVRDGC